MGCRNGQKKAETATLKKCRDRSFTWGAETGKMAFCIFLCRNGVIPSERYDPNNPAQVALLCIFNINKYFLEVKSYIQLIPYCVSLFFIKYHYLFF